MKQMKGKLCSYGSFLVDKGGNKYVSRAYHDWGRGTLNGTGRCGCGGYEQGYILKIREAKPSPATAAKPETMREALLKQGETKRLAVEEGKINR